jgi:formylglycine-generating enzyme required for sulfatase activity
MDDILRPPKVFISAVTSELGGLREALRKIFDRHGADVIAQKPYPTTLADGLAIQRAIDESDLVVCLIGWRYGRELPGGNRPPEAGPDDSWTQWEYRYARKRARAVRLFCYQGPNDAPGEPQHFADRQEAFREEVVETEEGTFGGLFYSTFRDAEEVTSAVEAFIQNRDGALGMFRAGTWAKVRAQYRAATVDRWRKGFPGADNTNGTDGTRGFPFITTQGFSILVPVAGQQQRFLKPEAFLPGRNSEIEASARRGSTWKTVTRAQLGNALLAPADQPTVLGGVSMPRRRRLYLVGGGGMGKTTNMRWLEAAFNGLDADERADENATPVEALALLVNFGDPNESLVDKNDEQVGTVLQHVIAKCLGLPEGGRSTESRWFMEAIEDGLRRDAAAGRLAILIDGLDHVGADKVPLLTSIQSEAPGRYWTPCTIVASGRPQAVQRWQDTPANMDSTVATSHWRFVEPAEFSEQEARFFLDTGDDEGRYQLVAEKLGKLVSVPRVLEYVRTLPLDQLGDVRTPADIYGKAIKELTLKTLAAGGKHARLIGAHRLSDSASGEPTYDQVEYIVELLSVFAFLSMCPTTDPDHWMPPCFDNLVITDDHKNQAWARLEPNHPISGDKSLDLARDLRALAAFSAIVGNGVLDAVGTVGDTMRCMVWSNRTIQEFLAAYWLAKHAKGAETLAARLAGKPLDIDAWDPRRDCERVRHYVFYPEDKETDLAYEFNQFLAEMPPSDRNPSSWVAAASAWFDPNPREQTEPASSGRKWSTEMLYRSWPTMLDIAGMALDDWWDLPYEGIFQCLPGAARAKANPHQRRASASHSPPAADLARKVLNRFRSDFQAILDGPRDATRRRLAHRLIADENWIAVPAGCYEMGAPLDKQGFPGKVEANWVKELDDVQTGKVTAKDAAKRSTKAEWFTGAQGERLREADIGWLTETFSRVEPRDRGSAPSKPDRNAESYVATLTALRDQWSRPDETPAENPQAVAAFTMHRFPILREWYYLFASGQRHAVQSYLGKVPSPGDDHPAIYISWFDAWAFCQWATWVVADETGANAQRRYGLRLPHEPEWEFAARWHRHREGAPTPTPHGQCYWWGDDFYESPDKPIAEPLTKPEAHAVGHPGDTRPPAEASPNGLGFHDILGNVWEWTANVYEPKYTRAFPQNDGSAARRHVPVNPERTMRGGLWYYLDVLANCSARFRLACNDRDYKMGFRVVREERPLK